MRELNAMELEKIAKDYGWDAEKLIAKKKSLQSQKTRLNQKKLGLGAAEYQKKLADLLNDIDAINQTLNYMNPKEKTVTSFEQADVNKLDYDQTMKAIASIQSAICRAQYLTKDVKDNVKYQAYKVIEGMLLEHKKTVKPVDEAYIRKTELEATIDAIKSAPDASLATVVEMLEELLNR